MWALPTAYFLSQVRVYISSFSFFVFFDGELRRRGNYLEYCSGYGSTYIYSVIRMSREGRTLVLYIVDRGIYVRKFA